MPLLALDRVTLAYGHLPLLDEASLQIDAGERVCILGRNGAGKSTLLQILSREVQPDTGSVWQQPGLRIARLEQDVPLSAARPVFDVVAEGLGDLSQLITRYHHAVTALEADASEAALDVVGRLQHELEEQDGWRLEQRVEQVLARLDLAPEAIVDTLSGGWRRRVLLARALVSQPDLLLLDEPTNHLDIDAIAWLESFLAEYAGAVVFVTHDRAFLQRLATRIVELDRGRLTSWPGDYETFLRKKEEWLADETTHQGKFDKKLAEEEAWLRQGIKARRTRNEGRVRALMAMRAERAARRDRLGHVTLQIEQAERSGQLVFEADHVTKAFGDRAVVCDFSTRIMRGDRLGLIGANGAGKTTLLRLLMGEMAPDAGDVRRGANVQVAYYDQQREQLDPERTVFETVGDGNEVVTVNGEARHVHGYLRDFLFPPERARSPVKALSGGERNRLLLARLFTRPANVLVLDEPTNDLDLETLELLEAQLAAWPGTLLLVSHDRVFLDHVVTSVLVFRAASDTAPAPALQEYVGGYSDWQHHEQALAAVRGAAREPGQTARGGTRPQQAPLPRTTAGAEARKKLTYRERQELEALPARIEALETEQREIHGAMASPEFFTHAPHLMTERVDRLAALERDLAAAYARWEDLDSRN